MGKKRKRKPHTGGARKSVLLYHDMAVYEDFERCARRVYQVVRLAQETRPGAPRVLYFDVQGHRNDVEAYDRDAYEMLSNFLLGFLMHYLTELSTPLIHVKNPHGQINDIPDELQFEYPPGETHFWYDVDLLALRPREITADERRSVPTRSAIAAYLGMTEACCLICFGTPTERAHVLPLSLGGSMDVRNFALLCQSHHQQAPDIADAEAFWAWVDYAEERDKGSKWVSAPPEVKEWLAAHGAQTEMAPRDDLDFLQEVQIELQNLYGWLPGDFKQANWDLIAEVHRVLEAATGKHFGIEKKVATHAWAYDVARRRLSAGSSRSQG